MNLSVSPQNAQHIALTGVGAAVSVDVYGEARSVPIAGGAINEDFAPYARHVYVMPAPDEIFRNGFE